MSDYAGFLQTQFQELCKNYRCSYPNKAALLVKYYKYCFGPYAMDNFDSSALLDKSLGNKSILHCVMKGGLSDPHLVCVHCLFPCSLLG